MHFTQFARTLIVGSCLLLLIANNTFAQDDDEFPPGLQAKYTANGKTVERIDPDVSFVWNGDSPDQRLPAGPFAAEWTGNLLNKKSGTYTFHIYVDGECSLEVDGTTLIEGKTRSPKWLSAKPVELRFGERKLRLRFRKTNKTARIQLFWSAERFPLEPIPSHLLFFPGVEQDDGARHAALKLVETGRVQFDAHRCNRCHVRTNDSPSPSAPDLTHVVTNLPAAELAAKIENPKYADAHAKMPSFGFNKEESAAIAAFLRSVSKPVKLNALPKPRRRRRSRQKPVPEKRAGEILVRSVGCLACHSMGKHGNHGPYAGGELSTVGDRRSAKWLSQWLRDPKKLNADHRMPVFKLSSDERRQIALYLAGKPSKKRAGSVSDRSSPDADRLRALTLPARQDQAGIARGKQLVTKANCAACHTIPGVKFNPAKIPDLSAKTINHKNSCVQGLATKNPAAHAPGSPGKTRRPRYTIKRHAAITAYLKSRVGRLSPVSTFAAGQLVLERRNCTACHPRGLKRGIVETAGAMSKTDSDLRGQSQALIPPALNAVGDKLRDEFLKAAIAGEQKTIRMPWLRVRMPRFAHPKGDSSALASYLTGHDRIPLQAPLATKRKAVKLPSDSQTLVAGQTLLGIRGFSCIACHKAGEYEPRNVAIGTRGSDLMRLAGRMRKPFFDRWTRSAIRIVPGMEMPSYHGKPVPGVLGDDVDLQLAVLWKALNDNRFKPPTNPSVVEQFLTVKPGEPARVVRDVFTVPKENGGGYVARSLAIGLNNGHNILFDLDTYSLRGWYFGDFARQRTQGKSWYWDMAGVPVMTGLTAGPDILLVKKDEKTGKETVIRPKKVNNVYARPFGVNLDGEDVSSYVWMVFSIDGKEREFIVADVIAPAKERSSGTRGWFRTVRLRKVVERNGERKLVDLTQEFAGLSLYVARPIAKTTIGQARVYTTAGPEAPAGKWRRFAGIADREYCRAEGTSIGLYYSTKLSPTRSKVELKPKQQAIQAETVTTVPGFNGIRLPISRSIMPTSMTWTDAEQLAFTSLKGHVFVAQDRNGDRVEDRLSRFAEGLAAPFGILPFRSGGSGFVVAHKSELLAVSKTDSSAGKPIGVLATGWGYNDNYHDWTCGIVRDAKGNLYIGLGSDYAQRNRPKEQSRWRGKVLKISPEGKITPVGHSFRYPIGLAANHEGEIFVTDNQGVQNTFNEINHLQQGKHYGVPSRHETNRDAPNTPPAIQIPHPWTRSVNGIFFLPKLRPAQKPGFSKKPGFYSAFAGHGIGCEYDNRFLIRFSLQKVEGVYQGACYAFSKPNSGVGGKNFTGPLCGGVAPDGAIYIGSIYDSGWLGGRNTGDIVRLVPNGKLPNGIRELRVTKEGFEIEFIRPVNRAAATKPGSYTISGYTRVWKGSYATPDSGRHSLKVTRAVLSKDGKTVRLTVPGRRAGEYVYDVSCGRIGSPEQPELWPATGYYTLHRIPAR